MSSHIEHESMENYLETIHKLGGLKHSVRSIDIARELGLSRPSVSRAVKILRERGLITVTEDGFISLTSAGNDLAERVMHIHACLVKFLLDTTGVTVVQADIDACRIEHVVSDETVKGIEDYISRNSLTAPETETEVCSHFPDSTELLESGENYLETIFILRRKKDWVRAVDIANLLNLSRASVSRAIGVLRQKGYLDIGEGNELILTAKGETCAREIYSKHLHLEAFLKFTLGIPDEIADKDACRIEHMISREAFQGIKKYLKNHGVKVG